MIFLTATTQTLEIKTTSAADIDYQINYVDVVAATSATPGSTQGKITSATTTLALSAPAASTSRQIKSIFIRNRHASLANTISVIKDISATEYLITGDVILQAGAVLVYESSTGWSLGTILQNNLTNPSISGYTDIAASTDPSAPAADVLRLYAKKISGRMVPKFKGPSGVDTPFQPAFFGNNIVIWNPGTTSGTMLGAVQTAIAAGASVLPTTTNKYTTLRRSVFTAATGINLMNSLRGEAMFFRGSVAGQGGFFFFCRFGFTTWTATNRLFVGMCVDTTALLTADPSSKLNLLGFGVGSADTDITFMHNDGSGTATKDTIAGQPALASNNVYDAFIFCKPNDSTVYYRLDDVSAGTTIIDSSTSSDLPVATTMLIPTCAIGSGPTNSGAGVAAIGLNRMYIETDF